MPGKWKVNCYLLAKQVLGSEWEGFQEEPGRTRMEFSTPLEESGLTIKDLHLQWRAEMHRKHFNLKQYETVHDWCADAAVTVIEGMCRAGKGDLQLAALEYAWT